MPEKSPGPTHVLFKFCEQAIAIINKSPVHATGPHMTFAHSYTSNSHA